MIEFRSYSYYQLFWFQVDKLTIKGNNSVFDLIFPSHIVLEQHNKRLLHDIFHIGPGIPISSPTAKVEGWYQERYGKFHVIIYLSHILHWVFSSIDFYIAEKIFELTNCENKSLRELPLFNLQIFLFRVLYNDVRKCL